MSCINNVVFRFGIYVIQIYCSDQGDEGLHISHPVHSDNCVLKDGEVVTCVKEHPAYTWRDYR